MNNIYISETDQTLRKFSRWYVPKLIQEQNMWNKYLLPCGMIIDIIILKTIQLDSQIFEMDSVQRVQTMSRKLASHLKIAFNDNLNGHYHNLNPKKL